MGGICAQQSPQCAIRLIRDHIAGEPLGGVEACPTMPPHLQLEPPAGLGHRVPVPRPSTEVFFQARSIYILLPPGHHVCQRNSVASWLPLEKEPMSGAGR